MSNIKRISVRRQGEVLTIVAPEGKAMAINDGILSHGILCIGEFGSGGIKIAAFSDWSEVIFDAEDYGYTMTIENPF
jgi:hypothetical protein